MNTLLKPIIATYYLLGVVVAATFLVRAVVIGGSHVGYGREVAQRQSQLRQLTDEQTTLERQLTQAQSLTLAQTQENTSKYIAITQTAVLSVPTSLALAQ